MGKQMTAKKEINKKKKKCIKNIGQGGGEKEKMGLVKLR